MTKFEAKTEAQCRLEYVFFNADAGLEFAVTPEFAIDSKNGEISLRSQLDFQTKRNYFVSFFIFILGRKRLSINLISFFVLPHFNFFRAREEVYLYTYFILKISIQNISLTHL